MKGLIAIFTVTAALSGGIVYAAASGVFGEPSSASNKANIVRPSEDPRTPDEIRAEALKRLKEQKHGASTDFKQGPDLAPPVVVTSPEEAAAEAAADAVAPRVVPNLPPNVAVTPGAESSTTSQPSNLTPDKIKSIVEKRIQNEPYPVNK
jgi:hypothetical protein